MKRYPLRFINYIMKILIASDCYIFQTGGVTNVVLNLEHGLRDLGYEVKVLALSNNGRSFKKGDSYFIRSFKTPIYPDQRRSLADHDLLLLELREWGPDLVHIHTEASTGRMAAAIARERGVSIVMTTHTDFAYFVFGRFRKLSLVKAMFAIWGRFAYAQAKTVIVPSEKARGFAQLQSVADRVTVIPNGITLEHYQKTVSPEERKALFRRYRLADNGYTLVMVTRLSREKNIMEILRYFPALLQSVPAARLLITGDGPDRRRLETFVIKEDLSRHVCFTGRIDPKEVYRYYAMGDVYVSASTFEVHSLSYLEAMACGLPLVCRADASLRNVLDDRENGIIYHTEEEFVEAVTRILGDRSLRESMKEKALEKVQEYDDEHFVDRTLTLYRKVLGQ